MQRETRSKLWKRVGSEADFLACSLRRDRKNAFTTQRKDDVNTACFLTEFRDIRRATPEQHPPLLLRT